MQESKAKQSQSRRIMKASPVLADNFASMVSMVDTAPPVGKPLADCLPRPAIGITIAGAGQNCVLLR
jgi:hypothetical protein